MGESVVQSSTEWIVGVDVDCRYLFRVARHINQTKEYQVQPITEITFEKQRRKMRRLIAKMKLFTML